MSTLVASNIEAPEDGDYPGKTISMEHLVRNACLAWLWFDQSGGNIVRGSSNISSVTDVTAGEHDGNFTSNAEAATSVVQSAISQGGDTLRGRRDPTTTEYTVLTWDDSAASYTDREVGSTARGVFA